MKKYLGKGVRLKQNKSDIIAAPIEEFETPERLLVCVPAVDTLNVGENDPVQAGQRLASGKDGYSAVFSPVDGVVKSISSYLHPQSGSSFLLTLERREDLQAKMPCAQPVVGREPELSDLDGLVDRLDGRPLIAKLQEFRRRGIKVLAVNAVDDQPYVCASAGLIKHQHNAVAEGLRLLCGLCGARTGQMFLYGSKSFSTYSFSQERFRDMVFIGGKYPARATLAEHYGREYGFVGAQTCLDVLEMLRSGRGPTHTVVTVAGDLIHAPVNFRVPIGTPVGALIDACAPSEEHGMVILGGPMTGCYVKDLSAPVDLRTEAVLFMRPSTLNASANCWGCAECVSVCPRGLMPLYIARFAKHERYQDALDFGASRCIECGCCSYVCSGGIDPMSFIVKAKRFGEISLIEQAGGASVPGQPVLSEEKVRQLTDDTSLFGGDEQ